LPQAVLGKFSFCDIHKRRNASAGPGNHAHLHINIPNIAGLGKNPAFVLGGNAGKALSSTVMIILHHFIVAGHHELGPPHPILDFIALKSHQGHKFGIHMKNHHIRINDDGSGSCVFKNAVVHLFLARQFQDLFFNAAVPVQPVQGFAKVCRKLF